MNHETRNPTMKKAPATFQRLMNRVTQGLSNCVVYLDDVVIFSDTWEQHLCELSEFFASHKNEFSWENSFLCGGVLRVPYLLIAIEPYNEELKLLFSHYCSETPAVSLDPPLRASIPLTPLRGGQGGGVV